MTHFLILAALAIGIFTGVANLGHRSQQSQEPKDLVIDQERTFSDEIHAEPVRFELDIPYAATQHPHQKLDLFTPAKKHSQKLPLIIFLHGGAWQQGDKSEGIDDLMDFVRSGRYIAASVNYRLIQDAAWPAQLYDCKAAIRWLRSHADNYGIDPQKISVWGRCAGGHLALMLGATGGKPSFEGMIGSHANVSSKISAIINFSGVVDLPSLRKHIGKTSKEDILSPEEQLIGGDLTTFIHAARDASPITYIKSDMPAVLTVHSQADQLIPFDQATMLDEILVRNDVQSFLIPLRDAGHDVFPKAAFKRVRQFLDRTLYGEDVVISTEEIFLNHNKKTA